MAFSRLPPPYEKHDRKIVEEKIRQQLLKYNQYMQADMVSLQQQRTKLQQNRSTITDVSNFLEQQIVTSTNTLFVFVFD